MRRGHGGFNRARSLKVNPTQIKVRSRSELRECKVGFPRNSYHEKIIDFSKSLSIEICDKEIMGEEFSQTGPRVLLPRRRQRNRLIVYIKLLLLFHR